MGYGAVDYAARPASSTDIDAFSGQAYFTGAMLSDTWTGTAAGGAYWSTSSSYKTNWLSGATWET